MNTRRLAFVLAAAVTTELIFLALCLFTEGGNAQGIWIPNAFQAAYILFHIPAKLIVEGLGCDDFTHFFVWGVVTGTLQFFLVYFVATMIITKKAT